MRVDRNVAVFLVRINFIFIIIYMPSRRHIPNIRIIFNYIPERMSPTSQTIFGMPSIRAIRTMILLFIPSPTIRCSVKDTVSCPT